MRLTSKLCLILSLLAIAVLGTSFLILYYVEQQHLTRQLEADQVSALEKLAQVCADSLLEDNRFIRLAYLKTFWASTRPGLIRYVALLDANNQVVMHSDLLIGKTDALNKPASDPLLLEASRRSGLFRAAGPEIELLAQPVQLNSRRLGTVAIGYDTAEIQKWVREVQRESLVRFMEAIGVAAGLSLLFALFIARMLTRPIRDLSTAAQRIGQGKLETRIPSERKDELGDLAREFNLMAKRLAELDELKESFLANITHDLRNPLGAITGYIEIVRAGIQGPVTPKQVHSLGIALQNGLYLAELINNMLDLMKLEAGKMDLALQEIVLREITDGVVDLMKVKADEFEVGLDDSRVAAEIQMWCDAQAIKRVMLNLVSNALKFTPKGGKVFLEAERLGDGSTRVCVRDTGIGIPKDKIGTLFQKFSQVAETKNKVRASKGTGLGLVICKELIEAHGGRIWAESEPARGTAFIFTLPAHASPPLGGTKEALHAG